jgi:hypothetical protein
MYGGRMTGGWEELHTEELHNFKAYHLPNAIKIIKLKMK